MSRSAANSVLLLTALIWGCTFVAQSTAMEKIGPLLFTALRFLIAAAAVAPLALWEASGRRRSDPEAKGSGIGGADIVPTLILSLVFLAGQITQQIGILGTTVTNAGFLTALYVILVPIFGIALYRQWPHGVVWPAALVALAGTWLLGGGLSGLRSGDVWVIVSAVFWALQVVLLGRLVERTGRPFLAVFAQSLAAGIAAVGLALLVEPFSLAMIAKAWPELLIAGGLSGGLAFSLQAIAQRHTGAADAAVVFSAESVFAALAAAVILGERLALRGWVGCALILLAVLAVQLAPLAAPWRLRRRRPAPT